MLIIVAKAKAYAKETHDIRLGADFLESLNKEIKVLIDCAVEEAKQEKIGTVKRRHLVPCDQAAV